MFSGDKEPFSVNNPPFFQLDCTALNVSPVTNQACTTTYPPLVLPPNTALIGADGVRQSGLGSVTRNGVTQVTYFGNPLYTFAGDTMPFQFNADNRGDFRGIFWLDSTEGSPVTHVLTVNTESTAFGTVLSAPNPDGAFRSVFSITAEAPNTNACDTICMSVWPPLLSGTREFPLGPHAGPRVDQALLGTIIRPDGSRQVTYNGHPLYYFTLDLEAGGPNGLTDGQYLIDQEAFGVWYLVDPAGHWNPGTSTIISEADGTGQILNLNSNDKTVTLYAFSKDSGGASACTTAPCAQQFPPVITTPPPAAGGSANGSLLGTIQRPDGQFQVTYAGQPLYYDSHALDQTTAGNGLAAFGGTFNVVNVTGAIGGLPLHGLGHRSLPYSRGGSRKAAPRTTTASGALADH